MAKWIVIYCGKKKGDSSSSSVPMSYQTAKVLFEVMNDSKYLVKVKRIKK